MSAASFKKEALVSLVDNNEADGLEYVEDRIVSNGRWSINHRMVFKDIGSGRFYEATYSVGATEQQDEGPFEHEGDFVTCAEVRPVEKTVTVYERAP